MQHAVRRRHVLEKSCTDLFHAVSVRAAEVLLPRCGAEGWHRRLGAGDIGQAARWVQGADIGRESMCAIPASMLITG